MTRSPLPEMAPPAELRARTLAAAIAEPVPPRRAGNARRARILAVGVGLTVAILMAIGGPGGYGRPSGYYVTLALLWLGVGLAGAWVGIARGRSMLGRPASARLMVATLSPLLLIATAAITGALTHPTAKAAGLPEHLRCNMFTLAFAVGPLVAFALLRRGSDPVAPRVTGAALGAVAGVIGALGIELRCSHAGLAHVIVGHVLPVAALALLGALVVGPVVATRSRALAPSPRG